MVLRAGSTNCCGIRTKCCQPFFSAFVIVGMRPSPAVDDDRDNLLAPRPLVILTFLGHSAQRETVQMDAKHAKRVQIHHGPPLVHPRRQLQEPLPELAGAVTSAGAADMAFLHNPGQRLWNKQEV